MTQTLIDSLTDELQPTKKMAHPLVRTAFWSVLSVIYIAIVVSVLQVRPDLANKASDTAFLFEVGLAAFIALTAALSSAWLSVPDMRGRGWLPSIPITGAGLLVFWNLIRGFTEGFAMPHLHWDHCLEDGLLMGVLPLASIIVMARRGATCCPRLSASMNILAVSMLGYVGLRFTCIMDTVGHSGVFHIAPFVIIALIMGASCRKLYKW